MLLGWPDDSLIAVVPGVIKSVKLAREALMAVSSTPELASRARRAPRRP